MQFSTTVYITLLQFTLKCLPQAQHFSCPAYGAILKANEYLRCGTLLEEVGKEGQTFEGYSPTLVPFLLTLLLDPSLQCEKSLPYVYVTMNTSMLSPL